MVDGLLGKLLAPLFKTATDKLRLEAVAAAGIGFAVGLSGLPAIGHGWLWAGLAILLLSRVIFALAGTRAQAGEAAKNLALVAVLKAVSLAGYPFAFALAMPEHAAACAFLMFGLVAAFAAGFAYPPPSGMGDFAIGGLDLTLVLGLCALLPDWFGPIAYAGGLICFAAAGLRIDAARRAS